MKVLILSGKDRKKYRARVKEKIASREEIAYEHGRRDGHRIATNQLEQILGAALMGVYCREGGQVSGEVHVEKSLIGKVYVRISDVWEPEVLGEVRGIRGKRIEFGMKSLEP